MTPYLLYSVLQAVITFKSTILKLLPVVFQNKVQYLPLKGIFCLNSLCLICISGSILCFCQNLGIQNIKDKGQHFSKGFSCELICIVRCVCATYSTRAFSVVFCRWHYSPGEMHSNDLMNR